MAATAAQVARLRRMTNEPTTKTYTDDDLVGYIESYPLADERGEASYTWNTATTPPAQTANTAWIPTYDLAAAAADIWEEKAAALASQYAFSSDGSRHELNQQHEGAQKQVRYWRGRRAAGSIRLQLEPPPVTLVEV